MKGVTKEVLAEVRARASIVDVVAETVVLKRAGKDYKGLCPFHKEKSPSFTVNADKGIFKCFGCGEAGDVFTYVQKVRGLDFPDSVRELANRYGVQLVESEEQRQEQDKRSLVRKVYEEACLFYQGLLKDPHEGLIARDYLHARGIDDATIEKFRLGYALNAWDGLISYLTSKLHVSNQFLEEAGLVRMKQGGGSYYDLFRHRLMVPICDGEGRVIAFGGRTLGDDQVKYINSPETPIYKKGEHLFALHLAKEAISKNDSVIVVEGYFDAITPHQFGFSNCVATLGTAMTEAQARLLVRYSESKRVYLSFDSDDAGQRAVERGVETLSQIAEGIGIQLRIIRMPGGKDPDECLRGVDGVERFQAAIENAPRIIDYQIEEAIREIDVRTHTGRIEASRRVVPVVARVKAGVARVEYIRQCAALLNIREEELLADVRQYRTENRLDQQGDRRFSNPNNPFNRDGGSQSFNPNYNRNQGGQSFSHSNNHGGNFQKGGKGKFGKPKETFGFTEEDVNGGPVRRPKGIAQSRLMQAERQLLAHYLVSRDDYDRVVTAMADYALITPEHQRIKQAIEGIGTQFQTMEDLQHRLMDRLSAEADVCQPLIEIILKVEEIRRQNLPVDVVIKDYKATLLAERLETVLSKARQSVGMSNDDTREAELGGRIAELNHLKRVELVSAQTPDDLDALKRKIEAIESAVSGGGADLIGSATN